MAIQATPAELSSLAILAALGRGTGRVPSGISAGILGGMGGGGDTGELPPELRRHEADKYPTSFTPGANHEYTVRYYPSGRGHVNGNSTGGANRQAIKEAGVMQSLEQHNAALLKYLRPGMSPKEQHVAIMLGAEEEKKLPQFWDDSEGRRRFAVSSSAVSGIRLTPDARVEVRWGTGPKWYTFKQYKDTYEASKAAQRLLLSDSIGRAVWPVVSRFKDKAPKKPLPAYLGTWNRPNYDGSMV